MAGGDCAWRGWCAWQGGMCSAGVCVQERRPPKRAVRILLECILVFIPFSRVVLKTHTVFSFIT